MHDLYRINRCVDCRKPHDLYDTSPEQHPPGGIYTYTCSTSNRVVETRRVKVPETVQALPTDAIPISWIAD